MFCCSQRCFIPRLCFISQIFFFLSCQGCSLSPPVDGLSAHNRPLTWRVVYRPADRLTRHHVNVILRQHLTTTSVPLCHVTLIFSLTPWRVPEVVNERLWTCASDTNLTSAVLPSLILFRRVVLSWSLTCFWSCLGLAGALCPGLVTRCFWSTWHTPGD